MWVSTFWRKISIGMILCSLLLLPVSAAMAQSPDEQQKTDVAENANVDAAAPSAVWSNVFYDEMNDFPTDWTRYDYNDTGQLWVYRTIDGFSTAQPSAYVLKENTQMYRTFSLVGALDARVSVRFKMNTEVLYDKLMIEYTCDSGRTWYGSPNSFSGNPGWTTSTLSLYSCRGFSSVQLRFTFVTNKEVIPARSIAPGIDYVVVQKYS